MNQQELDKNWNTSEIIHIAWKALVISFHTKSKTSLLVNITGFVMALAPVWISATLRQFTDQVQFISQGHESITKALWIFVLLGIIPFK